MTSFGAHSAFRLAAHTLHGWKLFGVLLVGALAACGGGSDSSVSQPQDAPLSAAAALGEKIFKDTSLSASRQQACSSCHDPANAHSPTNALAAQLGGPAMDQQGLRQAPSIRYLSFNTAFFFDGEGTPTGGFFWDGRAASLAQQASEPFLNPREMANAGKGDVVAQLSLASYAAEFKQLYGSNVLDDVDGAFQRMTLALQQYQKEDAEFRGFTSKYDNFLLGKAQLTAQEMRGLALFNSPTKGNCAGCHPSSRGADGALPLFTDFTYDNLGVPRNIDLQANNDPAYFDLGLCARPSGDMASHTDLCGAFKVPSLRNVAKRHVFFHNGRFKTLKDALTFYVQRDTNPEKFYSLNPDNTVNKFDDLPSKYHGNVNTTEVPYNRRPGDAPALSDSEIDDVIVFLNTLSDGYTP
ncbi:MAG: cytochrome c peroxidase [Rhizobacter sp.]